MISPAEIFQSVLYNITDRAVVPHVVVGPASHDQQQAGVLSVMDAGAEAVEHYLPLVRPRFQIRCIAPTLERCEAIGRHTEQMLAGINTRVVGGQSDGDFYLVHSVTVSSAPSAHRDSDGTWEYLLFAGTMMGTSPIPPTS